MSKMLIALAAAGLASKEELTEEQRREADALRERQEALRPKTIAELMADKDYDFLGRVKWLIEYLEADRNKYAEVMAAVEKHMCFGNAGREFLRQLTEWLNDGRTMEGLHEIKSRWPSLFSAMQAAVPML